MNFIVVFAVFRIQMAICQLNDNNDDVLIVPIQLAWNFIFMLRFLFVKLSFLFLISFLNNNNSAASMENIIDDRIDLPEDFLRDFQVIDVISKRKNCI